MLSARCITVRSSVDNTYAGEKVDTRHFTGNLTSTTYILVLKSIV